MRDGAGTGAGEADVQRIDAERFHEVQDFDFFFDAGVVDGGILQAVAERFVIQQNACARWNQRGGGLVPVVDPFVVCECGHFRDPWRQPLVTVCNSFYVEVLQLSLSDSFRMTRRCKRAQKLLPPNSPLFQAVVAEHGF